MKVRTKNVSFQSCRYCNAGGSLYRVDSEEGIYYLCEKHRQEKDSIRGLPVEGIEEEFGQAIGIIRKMITYIKGG